MNPRTTAYALEIDGRYYYGRGKKGQLLTAWSLAGAKLFPTWDGAEVEKIRDVAESRGKECRIVVASTEVLAEPA